MNLKDGDPSLEDVLEKLSNRRSGEPFPLNEEENRVFRKYLEEKNAKEREERERRERESRIGGKLILWPDDVGVIPTEITRTALFGLPRRGRRQFFRDKVVASRSDVSIRYTGHELDQSDLEVWMLVLYIARGQHVGQRLYTNLNSMLKGLDRQNGGAARKSLKSSLERLATARFNMKFKRVGKEYQVIAGFMNWGVEVDSGKMWVRVDPEGETLFSNLSYLEFQTHLALPTSMSKALHVYAIGHKRKKRHRVLVKDLKLWLGYNGTSKDFRRYLKLALRELEEQGIMSEIELSASTVEWTLGDLDYTKQQGITSTK